MSSRVWYLLFLCGGPLAGLQSQEASSSDLCEKGVHPMRVGVRHIEPEGIGYNQGYTTFEAFFAPWEPYRKSFIPFLDVRGHVFNDGQPAANAGLGVRYLDTSRVWGINSYYDYRKTAHQHYNQAALGLEMLGKLWDVRLNGYLPLGKKTSGPYGTPSFLNFKGHSLYVLQKQEFAMKGANAEAGYHIDWDSNSLYLAAGPYYLQGSKSAAWGGQARAAIDFCKYLRVEGNVSYDHVFKWIGQAQVGIVIPFGRRSMVKGRACSEAIALNARAYQRVDRFEIIPVSKRKHTFKAIDPGTGLPWKFWFVDNTSHSAGTFESPFSTLLAAQNASSSGQAIYVYPGDGTTAGMDQGITLKNNQLLLGASIANPISTTAGTISIPPMAATQPNLSTTSGNVITLANNNTVSGLNIDVVVNETNGIYGSNILNLTAYGNAFSSPSTITTNGISLMNPTGQILVNNSTFNGFTSLDSSNNGNGIYLLFNNGNQLNTLDVSNTAFLNIAVPSGNGGCGIFFDGNGALQDLISANNTFNNFSLGTVGIYNTAVINELSVSNNKFSEFNGSYGIFNGGTALSLSSKDNLFSNFNGGYSIVNNGPLGSLSSINETFSNFTNSSGLLNFASLNTLNLQNNTFNDFSNSIGVYNGYNLTTLNSENNTFSNFVLGSTGIYTIGPAYLLTTFNSSNDKFDSFSSSTAINQGQHVTTLNCTNDAFTDFTSGSIGFTNGWIITTQNSLDNTFTNFSGSSIAIENTSTVTDLNLINNAFTNFSASIGFQNSNVLSTLSSNNNLFSEFSDSSYGISNVSNITTLNSTNDTFSNLSMSSQGIASANGSFIENMNVANDAFNNLNDSIGIFYGLNITMSSSSVLIANNTFSSPENPTTGFATQILVTQGSLCLDLTGNAATPATTPAAYQFTQTSPGIFNSTTGSNFSATNTGTVSIGASTIGTCSE